MSQGCPLRACVHASFLHDWEEPGVRPMCCVEGCDCGKGESASEQDGAADALEAYLDEAFG